MNKNKIMSDEKFRKKCSKFNLDFLNFSIHEYSSETYLIMVPTVNSKVTVLMDKNYNIVEFVNDTSKETIDESYRNYNETPIFNNQIYNERDNFFGCSFCNISLKEINDLNDKIAFVSARQARDNIGEEKENDTLDRQYTQAASFIKFLGIAIDNYYCMYYHFKLLGIDFIDIGQYLRKIVCSIEICINKYLDDRQRPFSSNILEYLGIDDNSKYIYSLLHSIIEGFMQEKNMRSIPGYFNLVEIVTFENPEPNSIEMVIKKYNK